MNTHKYDFIRIIEKAIYHGISFESIDKQAIGISMMMPGKQLKKEMYQHAVFISMESVDSWINCSYEDLYKIKFNKPYNYKIFLDKMIDDCIFKTNKTKSKIKKPISLLGSFFKYYSPITSQVNAAVEGFSLKYTYDSFKEATIEYYKCIFVYEMEEHEAIDTAKEVYNRVMKEKVFNLLNDIIP